ncbi:MAG: RNA methyltransferase [Rhodospirillaceae bacterium]|nr:RNA methyltransferase [Rhodospirillaceae bacterium]
MRGYFGIGVEGVSKAINVGNLFRSANAFSASFMFTVGAVYSAEDGTADTSNATGQLPFYAFDSLNTMRLPDDCSLVGVEIHDDAVDLPSFRHPRCAAYVLGMERGSLSPEMVECCDHLIKIPTKFALNLAAAGAIVMYDRLTSVGRFGERPVTPGGPIQPLPEHVFGQPVWMKKKKKRTRERQS